MLTSPTPPAVEEGPATAESRGPETSAGRGGQTFKTGELVEVCTDSVRALARVRESSDGGRLHIAFEMGEYLPWVDTAVVIRHAAPPTGRRSAHESAEELGSPAPCVARARILHAGTSTALLQVLVELQELPRGREPFDTLPLLDD